MFRPYFRNLYVRTMRGPYGLAFDSIADALRPGGQVLDCGASAGSSYERLKDMIDLDRTRYAGIEWSEPLVQESVARCHRGTAVTGCRLRNRHLPSAEGLAASGIDIPDNAIAVFQDRLPSSELRISPGETLPTPNGSFDIVTCLESLEHFLDQPKAFREMVRVANRVRKC